MVLFYFLSLGIILLPVDRDFEIGYVTCHLTALVLVQWLKHIDIV